MSENQIEALQTVNRVLSKQLQKSEEDVKKLRTAVLKAASALSLAGYHTSADDLYEVWNETK